jgi:hypothetical protein
MLRIQKSSRMVKSWRGKNHGWILKSLQMMKSARPEKNRQMVKSSQALKSPRLVKYPRRWKNRRNWKSKQPPYCLGSAESPTADFSLFPLMSMFSSSLM